MGKNILDLNQLNLILQRLCKMSVFFCMNKFIKKKRTIKEKNHIYTTVFVFFQNTNTKRKNRLIKDYNNEHPPFRFRLRINAERAANSNTSRTPKSESTMK